MAICRHAGRDGSQACHGCEARTRALIPTTGHLADDDMTCSDEVLGTKFVKLCVGLS